MLLTRRRPAPLPVAMQAPVANTEVKEQFPKLKVSEKELSSETLAPKQLPVATKVESGATSRKITTLSLVKKTITKKEPHKFYPLNERLQALKEAYDTKSCNCKFKAIFYNRKGSTTGLNKGNQKPPILTDEEFNDAVSKSPDQEEYTPIVLTTYSELEERQESQLCVVKLMFDKMSDMAASIKNIEERYSLMVQPQIDQINKNQERIRDLLLEILSTSEPFYLQSEQLSMGEMAISNQLNEIDKTKHEFAAKLNSIKQTYKYVRDVLQGSQFVPQNVNNINLLITILKHQQKGITELTELIKSYNRKTDSINHFIND